MHAGGRGKGGGVIVCDSIEKVFQASEKLLGSKLITPQTDENGLAVNQVIIESGQDICKELYLGLLVDRSTSCITVLASTEGGVDIEQVASETPEKIIKHAIDPLGKLSVEEVPWTTSDQQRVQSGFLLLPVFQVLYTKRRPQPQRRLTRRLRY